MVPPGRVLGLVYNLARIQVLHGSRTGGGSDGQRGDGVWLRVAVERSDRGLGVEAIANPSEATVCTAFLAQYASRARSRAQALHFLAPLGCQ